MLRSWAEPPGRRALRDGWVPPQLPASSLPAVYNATCMPRLPVFVCPGFCQFHSVHMCCNECSSEGSSKTQQKACSQGINLTWCRPPAGGPGARAGGGPPQTAAGGPPARPPEGDPQLMAAGAPQPRAAGGPTQRAVGTLSARRPPPAPHPLHPRRRRAAAPPLPLHRAPAHSPHPRLGAPRPRWAAAPAAARPAAAPAPPQQDPLLSPPRHPAAPAPCIASSKWKWHWNQSRGTWRGAGGGLAGACSKHERPEGTAMVAAKAPAATVRSRPGRPACKPAWRQLQHFIVLAANAGQGC